MSSSSQHSGKPAGADASNSDVRPAGGRTTLPGPAAAPPATEPAGSADPTIPVSVATEDDDAVPIESEDIERVTLVELPAIARYGNYELLGRLAYGGMAEIFLARELGHEDTKRMMVVKRVLPHVAEDEHFVAMFVDEARLAMQLNHPNICHVYSFGEAESTYYIAMEWVNGKPLSKIIRQARANGGIPIPIALRIIAQVAEALDYAHRACDASGEPLGVVHRDVSPQNIMVSYDGVVKLLDFGIAKAASHSTRTEAGVIKGKFAYMSPQQCVGEPIDSRADIFALGICLYEALTAKNCFKRKTEFETMTKIVGDPTPKARDHRPEVPEAIEQVIATALMKQPERRYQSAGDMQLAIDAVIPSLGMPVNTSRVGEYVSALFSDEVRDGPALDTRLAHPPKETGSHDSLGSGESIEPPRRKRPDSTELDAHMIARVTPPPPRAQKSRGPMAMFLVGCLMLVLGSAGAILAVTLLGVPGQPDVRVEVDSSPTRAAPDPGPVAEPPLVPEVGDDETPVFEYGTVFVESVPPGATITFGDREDAGETPLEMGMIAPGSYDVTLRLEGHRDFQRRVTVEPGRRVAVLGELERVPTRRDRPPAGPPGQLSLNTRPWSKVYLGRRLLGTTPIGRVEVPSGTQRLRLVDRDGAEHQRSVRIPPGDHVAESFDLRE